MDDSSDVLLLGAKAEAPRVFLMYRCEAKGCEAVLAPPGGGPFGGSFVLSRSLVPLLPLAA